MTTPKGYPIETSKDDISLPNIQLQPKHATVTPMGNTRRGLDVASGGYYAHAEDVVIGGDNTRSRLQIVGHDYKAGDLIIVKTAVAVPQIVHLFIESVEVDYVNLAGAFDIILSAGDTVDIYRFTYQRLAPDGSSMATLVTGPMTYIKDGVTTTVQDSTTDPNFVAAIPVEIKAVGGTQITITAGDINVHTSHLGPNFDSQRIGDGTNLLAILGTGEATVSDATTHAKLDAANIILANIDAKSTDGSTETTQIAVVTKLGDIDSRLLNLNGKDFATTANQVTQISKLNDLYLSYRETGDAVLGTEEGQIFLANQNGVFAPLQMLGTGALSVAVESSPLPTGAATAANQTTEIGLLTDIRDDGSQVKAVLDTINLTGAKEATLAAMSAKLPPALGSQLPTDSLSIVPANGYLVSKSSVEDTAFNAFLESVSISNAAYTELIANTGGSVVHKVKVAYQGVTPLWLAIGGAGSEVNKILIPAGGWPEGYVDCIIPAGSRLSLISATTTTPSIKIYILGSTQVIIF